MIGDLTLLLLLAASPALPATPTEAACAGNGRTSLQLRTGPAAWPAHHDGPSGATTFLLRAVPGGELLHTERRGGRWRCLGAATTPRGYLAGGVLQRGGWLPLASVVYLPEAGGPAVPSSWRWLRWPARAAAYLPSWAAGGWSTGSTCWMSPATRCGGSGPRRRRLRIPASGPVVATSRSTGAAAGQMAWWTSSRRCCASSRRTSWRRPPARTVRVGAPGSGRCAATSWVGGMAGRFPLAPPRQAVAERLE
jgi:hypothetical protein